MRLQSCGFIRRSLRRPARTICFSKPGLQCPMIRWKIASLGETKSAEEPAAPLGGQPLLPGKTLGGKPRISLGSSGTSARSRPAGFFRVHNCRDQAFPFTHLHQILVLGHLQSCPGKKKPPAQRFGPGNFTPKLFCSGCAPVKKVVTNSFGRKTHRQQSVFLSRGDCFSTTKRNTDLEKTFPRGMVPSLGQGRAAFF